MKRALLTAATLAALTAQPAWACRQLIPTAKFRIADFVVDGVATCLKKSSVCSLKVLQVHKGHLKHGVNQKIAVDDAPPPPQAGPDEIVTRGCPETFVPIRAINKGRFYLRKRSDGSLYAFVPPDLQETEN